MNKQIDTATNASGDRFQIEYVRNGYWRATQIDGCERNYLSLPAMLHAFSRKELVADLAAHYSN